MIQRGFSISTRDMSVGLLDNQRVDCNGTLSICEVITLNILVNVGLPKCRLTLDVAQKHLQKTNKKFVWVPMTTPKLSPNIISRRSSLNGEFES